MKNKVFTSALFFGGIILANFANAQKTNETSAAVEFKNKYMIAMMQGNYDDAKAALISAKKFIDLAAEHVDTKESPKTLYYKGEIYSNFLILGLQTMDTNFVKLAGEDAFDVAIASYKKGFDVSDKFDIDIKDAVNQKRALFDQSATMMYNNKMYKEAGEVYFTQYQLMDAIKQIDTNALYNSGVCYDKGLEYVKAAKSYELAAKTGYNGTACFVLASQAYRNAKELDKAKAVLSEGLVKFPNNKELLLEIVNTYISAGESENAEKALNDAIANDPKNKQLHFTIGTIMMDLKKYDKAEKALNDAIALDPKYEDALYQLGALLVTWAGETRYSINQLDPDDARRDQLLKDSEGMFQRAVKSLEAYIAIQPNDKQVLTILSQIYKSLKNDAKSKEYQDRANSVK